MLQTAANQWPPAADSPLPREFRRLGWLGFWLQVGLIAMDLSLAGYVVMATTTPQTAEGGPRLANYISWASLAVLLFTTFWFFRYTRLGRRIADPYECPPQHDVEVNLWVGLWASWIGIAFSLVLLFLAAWHMLTVLLANPQTGLQFGVPVTDRPVGSISAIDAVSLMGLLVVLTAELIVTGMSLWLLFRTTRVTAAAPAS